MTEEVLLQARQAIRDHRGGGSILRAVAAIRKLVGTTVCLHGNALNNVEFLLLSIKTLTHNTPGRRLHPSPIYHPCPHH